VAYMVATEGAAKALGVSLEILEVRGTANLFELG
jgi:hypothetical protein